MVAGSSGADAGDLVLVQANGRSDRSGFTFVGEYFQTFGMQQVLGDQIAHRFARFERGVELNQGLGPEKPVVQFMFDEIFDAFVSDRNEALDVAGIVGDDFGAEVENVHGCEARPMSGRLGNYGNRAEYRSGAGHGRDGSRTLVTCIATLRWFALRWEGGTFGQVERGFGCGRDGLYASIKKLLFAGKSKGRGAARCNHYGDLRRKQPAGHARKMTW